MVYLPPLGPMLPRGQMRSRMRKRRPPQKPRTWRDLN